MASPATTTLSAPSHAGARTLMVATASVSPPVGQLTLNGRTYAYALEAPFQLGISAAINPTASPPFYSVAGPGGQPDELGIGAVVTFL